MCLLKIIHYNWLPLIDCMSVWKNTFLLCKICPSCEPCLPCVVALVIEPFPLMYLNPQSKNCQILWIMLAIARNFSVPYLSAPSPGFTTFGAVNICSDRQEVFQSFFFYCNFFCLIYSIEKLIPFKSSFKFYYILQLNLVLRIQALTYIL